MIYAYFFFFITFNLLHRSHSLQSGYTCEKSITLTCPKSQVIVILEVTYSTECKDELNGTSVYPPSRCIGYYRERTSTQCNGQEICTIDNSLEQRPSFFIGKQANCAFQGQSINVEYSCIPDFYSSKLPRIDICSLQSVDDLKEGFIHTPNYPDAYPNSLTCTKKIPAPDSGHRVKIYALDFDIESASVLRSTGVIRINDWLEINENGDKLYGTREAYTLLFDDVIEASLSFKSDLTNTKRSYHGFLLYFIVAPVRRSRPPVAKVITSTTLNEESTSIIQQKAAGLKVDDRRKNNTGLILLVVLLCGILVTIITGFLLYKRRNDRRLRYMSETFSSFKSKPATRESSDNSDEGKLNPKFDLLSTSSEDKLLSKYSDEKFQNIEHIYSQDPLENKNSLQKSGDNSNLYEYIDDEIMNPQKNYYFKPNENIV